MVATFWLLTGLTLACSPGEWGAAPAVEPIIIRSRLATITPTAQALLPAATAVATPVNLPTSADLSPTPTMPAPPTQPLPGEVTGPTPLAAAAPAEEWPQPTEEFLPPPAASSSDLVTPAVIFSEPPAGATPIVIPTATPIPETPGWSFANVRTYTDQYAGGLLLYGNLVNDTGATQEISFITGAFYDDQGQVIASQERTTEYWPVEVVPAGGRVPFELAVNGIQAAANFRLWANSVPSSQNPRQDFSFSGVEQWDDGRAYCLAGQLENSGGLDEDVVIAAVLYDSQGQVVNFGETYESEAGAEPIGFEICVDPPNQNVARYELQAWGE
jgi:hypothetical protein